VQHQDRQEREDILFRTLWAIDFYVELYICIYRKLRGLTNAVECSDAELINFAELLILNLKNNVKEI